MWNAILDILYPRYSLMGTEGMWITDAEHASLKLTPMLLHRDALRRRGIWHVDCVVAAGSYDSSPLLKKAILTFKYKRISSLHTNLAHWMVQAIPGLLLPTEERPHRLSPAQKPTICPVPLHWSRHFERGFNQAELLARSVALHQQWEMADLLKRSRATGHQAWRPRDERFLAMDGVFQLKQHTAVPSHIVLVDDICTTGATLNACAKVLKVNGAISVSALVAAYG